MINLFRIPNLDDTQTDVYLRAIFGFAQALSPLSSWIKIAHRLSQTSRNESVILYRLSQTSQKEFILLLRELS